MTEFSEVPGIPDIKIISGPESTDGWHPNMKRTVFECGDLTLKKTTYSNDKDGWEIARTQDLGQIRKGGLVSDMPPQLRINKTYGLDLISGFPKFGYDSPEVKHLYELGVQVLRKLRAELPMPDPKFFKLEKLMLPILQKPSLGEKVEVNKGDFIAEWNLDLGSFLVYLGEIDTFGEEMNKKMNKIAEIRAARSFRNAREFNFTRTKFKRKLFDMKPFYVSFKHFTLTDQHIVGVYWMSESEVSEPTSAFAFSKLDKKTFEMIKKEAKLLARKE